MTIFGRRLELTWKCNFSAIESPNYADLSENGLKLTIFFFFLPRIHSQTQFFYYRGQAYAKSSDLTKTD